MTAFFKKNKEVFLAVIVFSLLFLLFIICYLEFTKFVNAQNPSVGVWETAGVIEAVPATKHLVVPQEVRGIYWTAATAGGSRADQLIKYIKDSGLNSVVIDLKMDNGQLAFLPQDQSLILYVQKKPAIKNLDEILKKLYDNNIYRIARIPVMRDGGLALANKKIALKTKGGAIWQDNIGSLWVDPAASEVADYAITLAKEAYGRGFDEVQLDYIRFPSDGFVSSIVYPVYKKTQTKVFVMQAFFKKVGESLKAEGIPVSFDLFGITFWSDGDYNIGQRLLDAYPYADYISPMVYPSHYPNGFQGYSNPALYPYQIIKKTLDKGASVLLEKSNILEVDSRPKFRPWLQDFDIGAVYTAGRIQEEIRASREAGASGWILWNARNVYEPVDYLKKSLK